MNSGTIWIERELAEAAVILAEGEAGVVRAEIESGQHEMMVTVRYFYDNPHLKMVIAKELNRKIRQLTENHRGKLKEKMDELLTIGKLWPPRDELGRTIAPDEPLDWD